MTAKTMTPDTGQTVADLRIEIDEMAQIIHHAKAEIAAIKHPLADNDKIIGASSELDAIVSATESATSDILEAAEKIESSVEALSAHAGDAQKVAEIAPEMTEQLTHIMEACGFQDLTGQRITKVVQALRHIEDRISSILDIWDPNEFADIPVETRDNKDADAALLGGPQSDAARTSQEEIDALFD